MARDTAFPEQHRHSVTDFVVSWGFKLMLDGLSSLLKNSLQSNLAYAL